MKAVILPVILLVLAACGDSKDEADIEATEDKVFDPLIQSLDKAKTVEDTVLQQKEDMDEAMKRMEEGRDDPDKDQ
jgi:hypothetical protein